MSNRSLLLELPPELRVRIFEYVLESTQSQRPLFVLDRVYVQFSEETSPKATAVLRACSLFYKECLPLLYDTTSVEMSIRCEEDISTCQRPMANFGTIEGCRTLARLRHLELEITFDAENERSVLRATERLLNVSSVLNAYGQLKTLTLLFLQSGRHYRGDGIPGDALVRAAMQMRYDKLLEVSRNIAAKFAMRNSTWTELRRLAVNYDEEAKEQFQEISLDYWDRVFPEKPESIEPN
ncbi:hypothetical protein PRZ48_001150 [Zasmidium cellare]|uniref:F-box domain-containing protein n=1 Tax=Zasmidium cellare TaxID=395010 RepID=A0ABR0F1X1_ZASCE|nr:hypothetical protein PRZ48_001150 [Zasmidium cellare]